MRIFNRHKRKRTFWAGLFSAVCFAIILLWYLLSGNTDFMTAPAWVFYLCGCIGHAFTISLVISLIAVLLPNRLSTVAQTLLMWFAMALLVLNEKVYEQYRFHINGIVIDMLKGPGATQIFVFDTALVVKVVMIAVVMLACCVALVWLAGRIAERRMFKKKLLLLPLFAALSLVTAHLMHAYAMALGKSAIVKSAQRLPYFFPLTANSFMVNVLRVTTWEELESHTFDTSNSGELCYPRHELLTDTAAVDKKNIVIIAIDSWSARALTKETMPNVYDYADKHEWYTDHLTSNNGTRGGIFGLFYGVTAHYWNDFDMAGMSPILIDQLQRQGYSIQTYTGATLVSPPFARTIFRNCKGINLEMPGEMVYQRDSTLTARFLGDLNAYVRTSGHPDSWTPGHPNPRIFGSSNSENSPFFAFLFYDLTHSFQQNPQVRPFQPSWDYVDYTKLNNDLDPTPFWNVYRNCAYYVDSLIGQVFEGLEKSGLAENTVVVIVGDHGQEFNENKNNSWGHGIAGNFSRLQFNVPLIVSAPGKKATRHSYRTTQYDIAPTLLHDYLGVTNPTDDYSMGKLLSDSTSRGWHIAGDFLEMVFYTDDNIVIQKTPSGSLEVTDDKMRPINKDIDHTKLQATLKKLNMFYK